ncbi:TPA: hypothetical protein ACGO4I_000413 [Streptococcus suis]
MSDKSSFPKTSCASAYKRQEWVANNNVGYKVDMLLLLSTNVRIGVSSTTQTFVYPPFQSGEMVVAYLFVENWYN